MNQETPFPEELQRYWDVVEEQVCTKCVDGDGTGNCRLPSSEKCRLKSYFPLIVDLVNNVYSEDVDDYLTLLRIEVCSVCNCVQYNGECKKRDEIDCALDRYYRLVIRAIEAANQKCVESSRVPFEDKNLPIGDEDA